MCAARSKSRSKSSRKSSPSWKAASSDLSDALARYEEGVKHLKGCQQLLETAERKIELLSGVDAEGNPITKPFEEGEVDSLEGKGGRSRPAPHERREIDVGENQHAQQRHRRLPRLF